MNENNNDVTEVEQPLNELIKTESELINKLHACETNLDQKLLPGTMYVVRSEFDKIEGDVRRHVESLNNLKDVCSSVQNTMKCEEVKNINDVWKMI